MEFSAKTHSIIVLLNGAAEGDGGTYRRVLVPALDVP
jgi:hypothetical protein